jgi:hypothetical protein
MLNGGPIAWGSKKQSTTASNTTKAEYYAAHKGAGEICWMRQLLGDLGYPQTEPTDMYSDNQATIRLIRNPEFHQRTKYIDVKYHVIREYYQHGDLTIVYVTTDNNLADVFTKPLACDWSLPANLLLHGHEYLAELFSFPIRCEWEYWS